MMTSRGRIETRDVILVVHVSVVVEDFDDEVLVAVDWSSHWPLETVAEVRHILGAVYYFRRLSFTYT